MSVLAAAAALAGGSPAAADTLEVTRHSDPAPGRCKPNDCSLREAILAANARPGRDTVVLPDRRPAYELSRENEVPLVGEDTSRRGDLDVTGPLTLRHPGRGRATIDAQGIDRVLHVLPGGAATLVAVKLTGGGNVGAAPPRPARRRIEFGDGGGILAEGPVKLVRSAIVGNRQADHGGGIESYSAPVTVIRSVVARNRTDDSVGAGIDAFDAPVRLVRSVITRNRSDNAGGGVALASGELLMTKGTVSDNVGESGVGGVYLYEASGSIKASTISGNSTEPNASTGGIVLDDGIGVPVTLTITNSTIADNRAAEGGGGVSVSGAQAAASLRNTTVTRNDGDYDGDGGDGGGGLLEQFGGSITVVNSLIALNREGSTPNDCRTDGAFDSDGGNLVTTADGCTGFLFGAGDFLRPNPKIGVLRGNGGPTKTVALKAGSPAIGRAKPGPAPPRDQRGVRRDRRPDIGAFER